MGKEVNQIIDNICDKLGYAASEITPEMARYMIAQSVFGIVCAVLILIASIFGIRMVRKVNDEAVRCIFTIILLFAILVCGLSLVCDGSKLVGWIASPKGSMFEYILRQVSMR